MSGGSLCTNVVRAGEHVCVSRTVNASSWEVGAETFGGAGWTDLVEMGRSAPAEDDAFHVENPGDRSPRM